MHDKERGGAGRAVIRYVTRRNVDAIRQDFKDGMSAANSAQGLWLGLDTGGTYTDAVVLADGRRDNAGVKDRRIDAPR